MSIFEYPITVLDLKENYSLGFDIECHQNDELTLKFLVRNYGEIVDLTNWSIQLNVKKPDGTDYIQNVFGISKDSNGNLSIICENALTSIEGKAKGEIKFFDKTNSQITSRTIFLQIIPSVLSIDGEIHESTITLLNHLDDVLDKASELTDEFNADTEKFGEIVKTFDEKISTANIAITNLTNSTNIADTSKTDLDDSIQEANTSRINLDNSKINADKSKEALDKSEELANNSKIALEGSIATSDTAKTDLDKSISEATITKTNLDISITDANTIKINLDTSKTNADQSKTDLDKSISEANESKSLLDNSKELADISKINLDKSISEANEFVDNHGDIVDLDTKVNDISKEIVKARETYTDLDERITEGEGKGGFYMGTTLPNIEDRKSGILYMQIL